MSFIFTEADYENAILDLFKNMNYDYVFGPDVDRDFKSPLYDSVFEDSIKRINPNVDDNIFRSIHNVNLATLPGFRDCDSGELHSFLEKY